MSLTVLLYRCMGRLLTSSANIAIGLVSRSQTQTSDPSVRDNIKIVQGAKLRAWLLNTTILGFLHKQYHVCVCR